MMTIVAFLIAIGLLVTVHEFGHYLAARSCGVRVLRFSIGFGRTLLRYQSRPTATEWVLAILPLGGYVKMLDSREPVAAVADGLSTPIDWSQAFDRQSIPAKMWIVFAGPLANLLLALICYWGLTLPGEVGLKPYIGPIAADSVAQKADLRQGDQIVSIDGHDMHTWQQAQWALLTLLTDRASFQIVTRTTSGELHRHHLNLAQFTQAPTVDPLTALGLSMWTPAMPAVIGEVVAGSVADKRGLRSEDRILKVNQQQVEDWQQFVKWVRLSPNKSLTLTIARNGIRQTISVIPESVLEGTIKIGRLGAAAKPDPALFKPYLVERQFGFWEAGQHALHKVGETITFTLKMLWKMLTGQTSLKAISGPVSIADAAGQSADYGIKPYIGFIALLSISIAVMNLLPIPVLDGGHLLYHIVELIRRKPLSDRTLALTQRIGMSILGALMFIAFFNDINRYLIG